MEEAGTRAASESVHRQLRRRSGDLLSRQGRRGFSQDAGHDDEAETDGERNEDAGLQATGRKVRLSGILVWSLLFAEDGSSLYRNDPFQETGATHLSSDQ